MARPRILSSITLAMLIGGHGMAGWAHPRDARPPDWQRVIEDRDHDRLRQWRQTWLDGLASARAGGAGAKVEAEGALLKPDAAQAEPTPPDGAYRCRTIKLGTLPGTNTPPFVSLPAVPCVLRADRLAVLAGTQRPAGWIWPFDGVRLLFLGALTVGDESDGLRYGRDRERNLVGFVERIGPDRWRLVLPRPPWEALIDVVEIRPAADAP